MKIIHVAKFDPYLATRLLMQSGWDSTFHFLARGEKNSGSKEFTRLTIKSLLSTIMRSGKESCFVFHMQSSLPYLFFAIIARKIFFKQFKIIYDVHDLNQFNTNGGLYLKLRYYLLFIMELLTCKFFNVKIMTVSNGLSSILANNNKCIRPSVVMNISTNLINYTNIEGVQLNKSYGKFSLVYFGLVEHAPPMTFMDQFINSKMKLDIYGKGFESSIIWKPLFESELYNVEFCKSYSPLDMSFLYDYSILIFIKYSGGDNIAYSMANKVCQALMHGLSIIVSSNFVEVVDVFKDIPGAIGVIRDGDNIEELVDNLIAMRQDDYFFTINKKLEELYINSKKNYMNCTQL